jgi:NAD(P)-dependent dehydrogenase (short-subunit alcohol dehydrogenase family)
MAVSCDLSGKRVLVIGASSGLGREIGRMAAAAGARVAFAARRLERLEEEAKAAGRGAISVACDVRNPQDCARVVERTVAAFGGLDALVYSTAMSPLAMLEEASFEDWRAVLETNLVGAALIAQAAVPHLRASGGRAVFLSSYAIRQCLPGIALYRVSKLALDGLIESLRSEHPDLDFTRVVVGNTSGTEFGLGWDPGKRDRVIQTWVKRNLFPAPNTMPIDVLAEAVVSLLAVRGYIDDMAVMPRLRDQVMERTLEDNEKLRRPK